MIQHREGASKVAHAIASESSVCDLLIPEQDLSSARVSWSLLIYWPCCGGLFWGFQGSSFTRLFSSLLVGNCSFGGDFSMR